jgi:predicted MPP superfamily phosphohydrolase
VSFYTKFLIAMALAYGYVGWRLTAGTTSTLWDLVVCGLVGGLYVVAPITGKLRASGPEEPGVRPLTQLFFVTAGLMLMCVAMLLVRDTGWLLAWMIGALPTSSDALLHQTNVGLLALLVLAGLYGTYSAKRLAPVKPVDVPIVGLAEGLRGFRIVQLTDLHLGHATNRSYLRRVVERVNGLEADLIAITGDLIDRHVEKLDPWLDELDALKAKHGVFFVTGNHEYYTDAAAWVDALERRGLHVLVNEHRLIEHNGARLLVAGVTDYSGGDYLDEHTSDPAAALQDAPESDSVLFLAHQPRSCEATRGLGVDLQLSGHTHGGQIVPFSFVVRLQQPFLAGLYPFDSGFVYVSRGTGYWGPPYRILAPPEITLLTLRAA